MRRCEHFSSRSRNHWHDSTINLPHYHLDYIAAVFTDDQETLTAIEDAAAEQEYGPRAACTTIYNVSAQRLSCREHQNSPSYRTFLLITPSSNYAPNAIRRTAAVAASAPPLHSEVQDVGSPWICAGRVSLHPRRGLGYTYSPDSSSREYSQSCSCAGPDAPWQPPRRLARYDSTPLYAPPSRQVLSPRQISVDELPYTQRLASILGQSLAHLLLHPTCQGGQFPSWHWLERYAILFSRLGSSALTLNCSCSTNERTSGHRAASRGALHTRYD
jgi:hypothetical protein